MTIARIRVIFLTCNEKLLYQVQLLLKRESGEKPERSGHCIQGVNLKNHCVPNMTREGEGNDDL